MFLEQKINNYNKFFVTVRQQGCNIQFPLRQVNKDI